MDHRLTRCIPRVSSLLSIAALAAGAQPAAPEADMTANYYVATNGNDGWTGTLATPNGAGADGPFATLARARHVIRGVRDVPVTVHVRGGTYELDEPLVFTPEDSRSGDCSATYANYADEHPVLSGGRRIAGWQRGIGQLWQARIPDVEAGRWHFRQLFVNGRRALRARSPNTGFFRVEALAEEDRKPDARWSAGVESFVFKPGDLKTWPDPNDVEVVVLHSWNASRVRVAAVDTERSLVTFTGPTVFRPKAWDAEQRYYVENAPDALDAPGEWHLDRRTGLLRYWPRDGEDMTAATVVAPVLPRLLEVRGGPDAGLFVEHIHFRGLSFQHSDWQLPSQGYGDPQAAVTVPAAVTFRGALECSVERCEIAHVGTYGLWLGYASKRNRVVQCHVHDLGAGGVRIGEDKMAAEDTGEASHNVLANSWIHDGGQVYAAGVGVWIAQSSHNEIRHNEIHDFNYSGMSIGWNWSTAANRTHHNTVDSNHIHHVVRGMLSDGAGIYTLGTQTGTVLSNNHIHDVFPYMGAPTMAWGIYFDQGSNGILVEKNVVYNTVTGGIMQTGAHDNIVRNNIFAFSAWHAVWRWQKSAGPPARVERNIFYLTQGELFHMDGGQSDVETIWDHNCFWRTDGRPVEFYGQSFEEWQAKGLDVHSILADPGFIDAAHYDFRLKPGSPVLKLGFEPIDLSKTGLVGDPEWVGGPDRMRFPPTTLPGPPPELEPVNVDDGFEDTKTGSPPRLAKVQVEGRGDTIEVTDETAATGRQCLKVTDAPGLQHIWNPHMYYEPHFREGRADLSFAVRVEPGAVFTHEWRDAFRPFRVGPSLRIDASGTFEANGRPIATVPHSQWVHIEIRCPLGSKANGRYHLSLTLPRREPQEFPGLTCGSERFRRLEWLGFISFAADHAVFYLDNVTLNLPDR